MTQIIITGDDFGLALPVNEAIVRAHEQGVLTSASLMVGAPFSRDAVERARRAPTLRVGLHLTLVEGRPVLPPGRVPDLVDADGRFSTRLVKSGFRFFFLPRVRRQLEMEIRAQFEAFRRTGLELDHADAHNHMHLHPTVLGLMLRTGREYGLKSVRLPAEPPLRSWRAARRKLAPRAVSWAFLFPWTRMMRHRLRRAGMRHNDALIGMTDSGALTEDFVLRLLPRLPPGVTEFCFHPATGRAPEIDGPMPGYRHEDEFRALTGRRLKEALGAAGIRPVAFGDLETAAVQPGPTIQKGRL